ncbi:Aste57867_3693 [Aphanomyces stellatus]|uniref:Aste57867_3693 protein n=1 Tax=Aphanomyces stellatus TaxID=120398 RepID=A0A485KCL6_9STRA|nr:hypothetical protein As57867_003682 [Aphanomyces stellatus]VFT80848.1 Aste57867_3693 [Aphanomyces stellatus]
MKKSVSTGSWRRPASSSSPPPLFRLTIFVVLSIFFVVLLALHLVGSCLMLLWALVLLTRSTLTSRNHLAPYFSSYRKSCVKLYQIDAYILRWYDPSIERDLTVPRDERDILPAWHSLLYFYVWRGCIGGIVALAPTLFWAISTYFFFHFFNFDEMAWRGDHSSDADLYFYQTRWFLVVNGAAYISFGVIVANELVPWHLRWSKYANANLFPVEINYNIGSYESVGLLPPPFSQAKTMSFDQTVDFQVGGSPTVASVLKLAYHNQLAKEQAKWTLALANQLLRVLSNSDADAAAILRWLDATLQPYHSTSVEWDSDDLRNQLRKRTWEIQRLLATSSSPPPPTTLHDDSGIGMVLGGGHTTHHVVDEYSQVGTTMSISTGGGIDHASLVIVREDVEVDDDGCVTDMTRCVQVTEVSQHEPDDEGGWGPSSPRSYDPLVTYSTLDDDDDDADDVTDARRAYGQLSPPTSPRHPRLASTNHAVFRSLQLVPESPRRDVDPVHFTAYAPAIVHQGAVFSFDLWAFLVSQRDEMHERAREVNPQSHQLTRERLLRVRRGALVHVQLHLPVGLALERDEPTKALEWDGDATNVRFRVRCARDAPVQQTTVHATIVVGASVMTLTAYLFVAAATSSSLLDDDLIQTPVRCELERLAHTFAEIPFDALELHEDVGHGQYGDAVRATYAGQEVVVKTLRPQAFGDSTDQIVQEFRHEAAVLNMFGHHPNIVPFVGASTDPSSTLALVTAYLPCGNLHDAAPSLSVAEKEVVLYDAAAGLLNVHEGGFVHRDVAARNVLVDGNARGKLCDFGLCRRVQAAYGGSHFERQGTFPLKYMAPESLQPPHAFSYKTDVYGFGVLLWETFGEEAPFAELPPLEAARLVLEGHRLAPTQAVPAKYRPLIEACFDVDPVERPTLVEIMHALGGQMNVV